MISDRKRAANRLNAQKSTGPKTAQGKAAVAGNAITHGLTARAAVLPGEDESGYLALADALRRDLQPAGIVQREVVNHIAQITWKLRRVPLIEAAMMQREIEREQEYERRNQSSQRRRGVEPALAAVDPIKLLACEFAGSADNGYARLELYRLRLERSLYAAYRELRRMREETAGEEIESADSTVAWAPRPCTGGLSRERMGEAPMPRSQDSTAPLMPSGQNKPTDSPETRRGQKLDDSESDPFQPADIEKPPIETAQIEKTSFAFSGARQRHPL